MSDSETTKSSGNAELDKYLFDRNRSYGPTPKPLFITFIYGGIEYAIRAKDPPTPTVPVEKRPLDLPVGYRWVIAGKRRPDGVGDNNEIVSG
ncbi:hypothetical protein ABW20_dc0108335 [Dactylellina cionopaga]|nr:hypothetical protein ABW20_dc0108335 [Dactylellina cionopaga]